MPVVSPTMFFFGIMHAVEMWDGSFQVLLAGHWPVFLHSKGELY